MSIEFKRPEYFDTKGVQTLDVNDRFESCIDRIFDDYGVEVSFRKKRKPLIKFGLNRFIDSTAWKTLAQFADPAQTEFVELAGNEITHIVSNDIANTQDIYYEGHTIAGGDRTFLPDQIVALNGQTPVALPAPLNIVTRGYAISEELAPGSEVYFLTSANVTAGVPDDLTEVQLVIDADFFNQSEKLESALSSVDYYCIDQLFFGVNRKTSGVADVLLLKKEPGQIWRPVLPPIPASTNGANIAPVNLEEPIIIPANSKFRAVARTASGSGLQVSGYVSGRLATKVNP